MSKSIVKKNNAGEIVCCIKQWLGIKMQFISIDIEILVAVMKPGWEKVQKVKCAQGNRQKWKGWIGISLATAWCGRECNRYGNGVIATLLLLATTLDQLTRSDPLPSSLRVMCHERIRVYFFSIDYLFLFLLDTLSSSSLIRFDRLNP